MIDEKPSEHQQELAAFIKLAEKMVLEKHPNSTTYITAMDKVARSVYEELTVKETECLLEVKKFRLQEVK